MSLHLPNTVNTMEIELVINFILLLIYKKMNRAIGRNAIDDKIFADETRGSSEEAHHFYRVLFNIKKFIVFRLDSA